jgi:hypothetical protein
MSNFLGFDVKVDPKDGTEILIANAVVHVRDITAADSATGAGAIALDDIVADADGHVASATLPVAVGRVIRFTWVRDADMACGAVRRTTT